MNLFSFDSPFMATLGKAVEYMLISLISLVCCIPVVTVGAAVTAQYYVGMKLIRGEDTAFFKAYFRSFRDNFKQSTIIWLIEVVIGAFLAMDWYLIYSNGGENYNQIFKILLGIVTVYLVMAGVAVFPLIARFEMTTFEALKGALAYTYVNIPRMILVLILLAFPTVASMKYPNWLMAIWPIGSAAGLYIISFHFAKSFTKLENHILGVDESGEGTEEAIEENADEAVTGTSDKIDSVINE